MGGPGFGQTPGTPRFRVLAGVAFGTPPAPARPRLYRGPALRGGRVSRPGCGRRRREERRGPVPRHAGLAAAAGLPGRRRRPGRHPQPGRQVPRAGGEQERLPGRGRLPGRPRHRQGRHRRLQGRLPARAGDRQPLQGQRRLPGRGARPRRRRRRGPRWTTARTSPAPRPTAAARSAARAHRLPGPASASWRPSSSRTTRPSSRSAATRCSTRSRPSSSPTRTSRRCAWKATPTTRARPTTTGTCPSGAPRRWWTTSWARACSASAWRPQGFGPEQPIADNAKAGRPREEPPRRIQDRRGGRRRADDAGLLLSADPLQKQGTPFMLMNVMHTLVRGHSSRTARAGFPAAALCSLFLLTGCETAVAARPPPPNPCSRASRRRSWATAGSSPASSVTTATRCPATAVRPPAPSRRATSVTCPATPARWRACAATTSPTPARPCDDGDTAGGSQRLFGHV